MRIISISVEFARSITSSFVIKWSHLILGIDLRCRCWMVPRGFMWWRYRVQVSLPYIISGMVHWLYTLSFVSTVRSLQSKTLSLSLPIAHDATWIRSHPLATNNEQSPSMWLSLDVKQDDLLMWYLIASLPVPWYIRIFLLPTYYPCLEWPPSWGCPFPKPHCLEF